MAKLPVMNVLSTICEVTFGSKLQAINEIRKHKLAVPGQSSQFEPWDDLPKDETIHC
jgi:hypothetical protein